MEGEEKNKIYVKDANCNIGFELIRSDDGILIVDIKKKSRDKKMPNNVRIEALEVIDQITAAMNMKERLQAYENIVARMEKNKDIKS